MTAEFGRFWQAIAAPFDGPLPGGKDLDGEQFTPDTEFEVDRSTRLPVKWHHDRDPLQLIKGDLGSATNWRRSSKGLLADVDLDLDSPFVRLVSLLGVPLYVSTSIRDGTTPRKAADGRILRWPIGELSLTTSPQNAYAVLIPRAPMEQLRDTLDYRTHVFSAARRAA